MMSILLLLLTSSIDIYPVKDLLVEPSELKAQGDKPAFLILDARPLVAYQKGHVPGALHIDPAEWAKQFQDGKDEIAWSDRLGKLGIFPDSRIVIYDDASNKDAARVWWILKFWGLKDVRLLNGMWTGWVESKLPISDQTGVTKASHIELKKSRGRLATKQDVLQALSAKSSGIVDARTEAEYTGKNQLKNKFGGCIPGARNLDWEQLVDAKTKRFKSADEMRKLFADARIDVNAPQIAHCQGGGRSSVMAFALELMGAKDVRNYHASWGEWGNSDDVPIEKK
jgi:thiosulfate/3-mercaptopyruvate sulfurtransferase